MNRRKFIKSLAACGAVMTLPMDKVAFAANNPDRFLIIVRAGGGWDTTSICDPKGEVAYSDKGDFINKYKTADIRRSGNLRYAPIAAGVNLDYDWMDHVFQNYRDDMIVINGVGCLTGSHAQGNFYLASGQNFSNFPTLGALHAASFGTGMAMPYYSAGPHSATGGEVSAVRIDSSASVDKLFNTNPDQPDAIRTMLKSKRQDLLDHLGYDASTPSKEQTLKQFKASDLNSGEIARVLDYLPTNSSNFQAEMCAALLASGQSATTAFAARGGFDNHADNDKKTALAANELFEDVDYLWKELHRHGIAHKTTVMIGSEFGRTPWYNHGNGKDHWATGSVILMSPSLNGNRVVGGTTDALKPELFDPKTLEVDRDNGIPITIQHVHKALRHHLGLAGLPINSKYPMPVDLLPIFG